jgi:hypothetical protein
MFLRKRKFSRVFDNNSFHGNESLSGRGSDLDQTQVIETELPKLFLDLQIESLLDIPCGDQNWIKRIDLSFLKYTGGDIVPNLVKLNNEIYGSEVKTFVEIDIVKSVPEYHDLIFCRDLLVHLDTKSILAALANMKKSGATYLLTTTFTNNRNYKNLPLLSRSVGWRPINLELEPFNFPKPRLTLNEGCTEGDGLFTDKSLALWKLTDLDI